MCIVLRAMSQPLEPRTANGETSLAIVSRWSTPDHLTNQPLTPDQHHMAANPLDRLLKPRFPSAAVGIEGDGASVVQLDRAKGAFIVKRAASVSLPAQVVRPGFESSNIREPVELATALTDLITSAGLLRQRKWSTSLPEASTRSAIITIEGATSSRREIEEMFEWKIERTFGAPSSQLASIARAVGAGCAKTVALPGECGSAGSTG